MARSQSPPVLAQLRNARTYSEQTAAMRSLKNEVVGHIQKKEDWIRQGILEPIVKSFSASRSPTRQNGKDSRFRLVPRPLSEEDGVRLQALQLVASFANGGPAFLAPLHAANALPAILVNISPYTNPPQIVVAALKALTNIADASALAAPSSPLDLRTLSDSVLSSQHLGSLNAMLSVSSTNVIVQSQVALAAGLISRLCQEEKHQHALATVGVLDSLAARLASFAVAEGHVVPGASSAAEGDGLLEVFPESAPSGAKLGPILEAIAAILGDSKYRACRLINSPAILAVFPPLKFEPFKGFPDPRHDLEHAGFCYMRQQPLTAMEYILPAVPITMSRNTSVTHGPFPTLSRSESQTSSRTSLSKLGSSTMWDSPRFQPFAQNGEPDPEDIESPFIPWLIYLVRSRSEDERLLAASVLATLFKAGLGNKGLRETSLGLLVVPILLDMMARNDKEEAGQEATTVTQRLILEKAPLVLARLITDSEYLQKAAYESDAVKVISKLLREAYTPVQSLAEPQFWSPHPDTEMDDEANVSISLLGETGQNSLLVHRLRVRESALKAIGALAAGKEDYRKALVAEDIVIYVVESLSEFPQKPRSSKDRSKDKPSGETRAGSNASGYGTNPLSVIIAGCHVIRLLSRSVSVLRTALVDNAVAVPIFKFMKHHDVNVQVAATATIINLVVEVSPVRELLTEHGVVTVLCEHAHSDNPALRLNALWALKHFVDAVGQDLKKACVEELEPGWLVQLICDDTEDSALYSRAKDAGSDDMDDDVDMQPLDEVHRWLHGSNGVVHELDASQSTRLRQAEARLAAVREAELNPVRRARNDDVAIQEQGLDIIRNLIARPGPGASSESPNETTEMIDYLFSELGPDRLFEILASKLRAKVLHPFSRRTPVAGREARVLHPQAKIIVPVIYILVHIAASIPRHRQVVIAQTDLLKLLAQQSSSKDREVRVALCHLIINLTWQEDDGEAEACAQRALELKKLGFLSKMDTLRHQDKDLDVRERAKTAAWQLEQATF